MAFQAQNPNGQAAMANSSPVVIASDQSAVPVSVSGVSTAAKQDTIIGHVDGIEGLLTTIDADTGNISTKIDTVAGAVSGSEMQVDVITMPTTTVQATNLDIRDLSSASDSVSAAQSGTWNITNVSGTVSLPTGASTLAEQQTQTTHLATIAGDTTDIEAAVELIDDGIATVASAITTKGMAAVGTDGTNARILKTDTSGELQVDVLTMPTVTVTATNLDVQSGGADLATSAQAGAIQTATELIDDTVATLGTTTYTEATTKGLVIGAVRRDADTTLVNTTNEVSPLQVDANGRLKVEAFSGETLPVSLTSTTVTGTVAVTQSGTWDEVGINDSGNSITVDAPVGTPVFVRLSDGSSAISTLPVSIASVPSHAVTNAGTFAVQENGAALTALQLIDDVVFVDDTATHSTGSTKGVGIMAAATPSDGSVNANDIGMVAMTTDRKLHVSVQDALPAGTNAIGKLSANSGVDIGDVDVTSVIAGTGATSLGKAEDAAHTTGDTGVAVLQRRIDTAATSADTSGDYATANQSAEGATWVTTTPTTTSGLSVANFTSGDTYTALTNSAQAIKASAGNLYGYYMYNPNASATYVMVYNIAAASVTVGTSTPLLVFAIPATSAANLMFSYPITFSNAGWSAAAATTAGGNSAPSTALEVMFWYK